ncbi:MAG TPA: hypothetical protein VIW28_03630, partial [Gemmatimonadales bacterium]
PAVPRARPGVRWCKIWQDGRAARADGVRFVHWLAWALRCEAKSAWSWDDPLPLLCAGALASLRRLAELARSLFPLHVRPTKARVP